MINVLRWSSCNVFICLFHFSIKFSINKNISSILKFSKVSLIYKSLKLNILLKSYSCNNSWMFDWERSFIQLWIVYDKEGISSLILLSCIFHLIQRVLNILRLIIRYFAILNFIFGLSMLNKNVIMISRAIR